MSGAPELAEITAELIRDHSVLEVTPTIEFHGFHAVEAVGGCAILPWRAHARAARASGCETQPNLGHLSGYAQAVVHLGKGRAGGEADLAAAWSALAPGGRLLIVGFNDIGITTWAKRIGQQLDQSGQVLVNRARGRVVAFSKSSTAWLPPAPTTVALPDGRPLVVAPGVFSGDGLDGGTAALLAVLADEVANLASGARIADVGCGAGHLGLAAQILRPDARVLLLDADARAVACAQKNVPSSTCAWWDDQDPWPGDGVDLALLNPPCHRGTTPDLTIARRLFRAIPARRLLVVANRQLAYEADLAALGQVSRIADDGRFKILALTR